MTPEELAGLADEYLALNKERLIADKVAKDLKTKEEICHAQLVAELLANNMTGIAGRVGAVSIPSMPSLKPTPADWNLIWAHILSTGDFSLLQRRLSDSAVKERWTSGVEVPGVTAFPVYRLSKRGVK